MKIKNVEDTLNKYKNEKSIELFNTTSNLLNLECQLKLDKYIYDLANPIWKCIQIAEDGTSCIVSNTGIIKDHNGIVIKQYLNSSEYPTVWIRSINNSKVCYARLVHRLVATAFIPNPENKPEVNHIKNNPNINWVGNLEWVTSKENKEHIRRLGNQIIGMNHKNSKSTDDQIHTVCKFLEEDNLNIKEISKITGVSIKTINHIRFDGGWPHIRKFYNINENKLNNGPKFSELSNLIIDMIKSGMDNKSIYEELDKSGLSSNYKRKSISDRIYHIRKNIV